MTDTVAEEATTEDDVVPIQVHDPLYGQVIASLETDLREAKRKARRLEDQISNEEPIRSEIHHFRLEQERMKQVIETMHQRVEAMHTMVETMYTTHRKIYKV